jgi:hypothetical protein
MPTIMSKIFSKPKPREFFTHEHFKARQQSQSDPAGWHPVQAICVAVGALSGLTLASVVFLQVIAGAASEMPPVAYLARLDSAMYLSSAGIFASVCILTAFNRFRTK